MNDSLETERLILRRFAASDLDQLVELDSDPEVMRFLTGGAATPREVVERDILPRFLQAHDRAPGYGFWAAVERGGGAFVGWFSLQPRPQVDLAEAVLGYRLRRAAWGRGYGTEGARALIRRGFAELGVRRISATTYEDNLASRRVMEKAGLTLVRSYRLTPTDLAAQDTYHAASQDLWDRDDVEYALEKADWERQEAATFSEDVPAGQ